MARMIGYTCQPFCGKACCREHGSRKTQRRYETKIAKRREERAWRKELKAA